MQNIVTLHMYLILPTQQFLSKSAKRLESINSIKNGETIRQWLWHIWLKTIHQELSTLENHCRNHAL
jgi:hypothetical protein